MISELDIIIRLTISALMGGLIGMERERHNQPAGLRTHTILSVGSTLAMCVSIQMAIQFKEFTMNGDPARLAAQVISGIGFLGAGAIIRFGTNIKGLTTATSLWTVAIVGLAIGAGHYLSAGYATVLLLFALTILDKWEKRVVVHTSTHTVTVRAMYQPEFIDNIRNELAAMNAEIKSLTFTKHVETNEIVVKILTKIRGRSAETLLIKKISAIPGCKDIGLE